MLTSHTSQVSIEFILLSALMLMMVLVAMQVANQQRNLVYQDNLRREVRNLAEKVSLNINTAYIEGSGYSTVFNVPDSVGGRNYTISIEADRVYIDWQQGSLSSHLITSNITGSIQKGSNKVRNDDGVVIIE